MRPAISELIEDYCREILNAPTEEELQTIKQDIIVTLKEYGFSDEAIQNFFLSAAQKEVAMILEENQEVEAIQEVSNNNLSQTVTAGGVGLGLTVLMLSLALKQKNLKNKKQIKK